MLSDKVALGVTVAAGNAVLASYHSVSLSSHARAARPPQPHDAQLTDDQTQRVECSTAAHNKSQTADRACPAAVLRAALSPPPGLTVQGASHGGQLPCVSRVPV
jgi:hypothetical protein